MKKFLIIGFLFHFSIGFSQNLTYQQKLFYTCKVWGFVKYYHSEVSTCKVNWDSTLISRLPLIKNVITVNDFNNQIDSLLIAAGNTKIVSGILPDTLPKELKINLNFDWFHDSIWRKDVTSILDTIRNNFRPHSSCWVSDNDYSGSYSGWLVFPNDSMMFKNKTYLTYPNEYERLLIFFKYWNLLNYFNPNSYLLDKPWDSTLKNYVIPIANAANSQIFYFTLKKAAHNLNDAHTEGLTFSSYYSPPNYYYSPKIILTNLQNKYYVAATALTGISIGDEIKEINGITTQVMEDSLRKYISYGNNAVFHRFMCGYILNGYKNSNLKITFSDSLGNIKNLNTNRNTYVYDQWFLDYYPNDTLAKISWKLFPCGIGYVNMGVLQTSEVATMYQNLKNCKSIIFDIRNYPNGTAWSIANLMYPNMKLFAKFTVPNVNYPGTFLWSNDFLGINGNSTPYTGKVILLANEQTQSQAEFSCMILQAMPNSITIGSQTAGADGNISYFGLARDLQAGFTTLGVFYPNGTKTQRDGITIDSLIYPTPYGLRLHKDEVLEKALLIADCNTSIDNNLRVESSIVIYPNPSSGEVTISSGSSEQKLISVIDCNGKTILTKTFVSSIIIDLSNLSNGIYLINMQTQSQTTSKKLIITH